MAAGDVVVVAADPVGLGCRSCHGSAQVSREASAFDCAACRRRNFIVVCSQCEGADVVAGAGKRLPTGWECPWCLHRTANVGLAKLSRRSAQAAAAWQSYEQHGLTRGEAEVRVIGGFEVLAGSGDCPPVGAVCSVCALDSAVRVVAEIGAEGSVEIPYRLLLEVTARGAGLVTSGGQMVAGGTTVKGALTGMVVASAVNQATRKTTIDCVLRLVSEVCVVELRHRRYTPDGLRGALGRVFAGQLAAGRQPHVVAVAGWSDGFATDGVGAPLDELERLTKLHAAGTLTDVEFEAARALQIARLQDRGTD